MQIYYKWRIEKFRSFGWVKITGNVMIEEDTVERDKNDLSREGDGIEAL